MCVACCLATGDNGVKARDREIASEVRISILSNLRIDPKRLHVDVKDGTVTLTGSVASIELRELADEVAWQIVGVRNVINRLVVEPPAMTAGGSG
jgi:osmotically-inducible protein OsmY